MEGDVVFADEVVGLGLGVFPERLPGVRVALILGPLDRRREVTDHGLEPDVDPLRFEALDGHGDAPVDIARDRSVLEPLAQHPL